LSKLRKQLLDIGLNGQVVSKPENIQYLSGFKGSEGLILVCLDKSFILTDFRSFSLAKNLKSEAEAILVEKSALNTIANLANEIGLTKLGLEASHLSYSQFKDAEKKLSDIKITPTVNFIEHIRLIKDQSEIGLIQKAAELADGTLNHIINMLVPGVAEAEIANEIDYYLKLAGARKCSFDTIVASGPNSSIPHAIPTQRHLSKGDLLKIDFGAYFDGYCSDITRTFVLGKASNEQKRLYSIVLEAQKRALDTVKPGIKASQIDKAARDYIESKKYGQNFGHNTGHGVGMEIHEQPSISRVSDTIIQENMVFTVEPGVYLDGFGGVRIEDLVVAAEDGVNILSKFEKEKLIEL